MIQKILPINGRRIGIISVQSYVMRPSIMEAGLILSRMH